MLQITVADSETPTEVTFNLNISGSPVSVKLTWDEANKAWSVTTDPSNISKDVTHEIVQGNVQGTLSDGSCPCGKCRSSIL